MINNSIKTPVSAQFNPTFMPSGKQIYDNIMSKINPELVTANINTLDASYSKETPAERATRYKNYNKAFKEYKKQYKVWLTTIKQAMTVYKKAVRKASERVNKKSENTALTVLESQMLSN